LLTAAIVWTAVNGQFGPSNPDPSVRPSVALPSPSASLPPAPSVASYPGQALGPTAPPLPTGDKAQSRLWVADGSWWAAMFEPLSQTFHIYELVSAGAAWRDTGTVVDDRRLAQLDTLWDGKHLYIAGAVRTAAASGAATLSRFTYDPKLRRFVLDPNFPVPITATGVDSIVLTQDSTGKLWTTFIAEDGQVTINRTLGNDLFWGQPFALPVAHSLVTKEEVVTVLAYGPGRVAVMWSSQADGSFYLSSHEDGDPDEAWGEPESALAGPGLAGGQLRAMAAPDGRIFAVVKTAADDDPTSNGRSPQVILLTRALDAVWTSVLYGRVQDQHASPAVALDPTAGLVYVLATTPKKGGAIYYKRTFADDPSFEPGLGDPFITDATATTIGRATSGKDPVTAQTGLVVLAYDPVTFRYIHGVMDLGGGVLAGTLPADPPAARPRLLFFDDFDPWPIGSSPSTGWQLRPNDPPKSMTIQANPSKTDRSASIAAPKAGTFVRVCKGFAPVKSGDVTVDIRVRLARTGSSDGVLTEVRGTGVESASLRFARNGFFAYYKGSAKIKTLIPVRSGAWYRSIVVVHMARKTYDWRLLNARGRVLISVKGVGWRSPSAAAIDKICLRTPDGGRGIALNWDDVSVIH
jgi:hypothetical protein